MIIINRNEPFQPLPNDILLIMPGSLGDILLLTGCLPELKTQNPSSRLFVMTRPICYNILEENCYISGLLQFTDHHSEDRYQFVKTLKPYIETQKCKWWKRPDRKHFAELYADHCGVTLNQSIIKPDFDSLPLSLEKFTPYITLQAQSRDGTKNWDYFSQLIRQLKDRLPQYSFLLLGGKWEKPIWHSSKNLRGKLTPRQTAAVIAKADLHIGVDSFCGHIAASLDKPSIILYGGTYSKYCHPLRNAVTLDPIDRNGCVEPCHLKKCFQKEKCINNISVSQVVEHSCQVLSSS